MAPNHSRLLRQLQQHLSPVPAAAAETVEPTFREMFTKHEIKVPMRDGVKLHTTICKRCSALSACAAPPVTANVAPPPLALPPDLRSPPRH
jgi:predicted acyl esterase